MADCYLVTITPTTSPGCLNLGPESTTMIKGIMS